jgi:hypothetical protein
MKTIIAIILTGMLLTSCMEEGKLRVENKIHNVKIENISFGNISVYSSLLPGESSDDVVVSDYREKFPKVNQLEFYMVSNGNRVYLKTKSKYRLDYGETLKIIISDTTEVINPLLE